MWPSYRYGSWCDTVHRRVFLHRSRLWRPHTRSKTFHHNWVSLLIFFYLCFLFDWSDGHCYQLADKAYRLEMCKWLDVLYIIIFVGLYFFEAIMTWFNHIDGVMVSVIASGMLCRGLVPRSGQTNWYMLPLRQSRNMHSSSFIIPLCKTQRQVLLSPHTISDWVLQPIVLSFLVKAFYAGVYTVKF